MELRRRVQTVLAGFLLLVWGASSALAERVTVDSLEELMPYLSQDNVDLVMSPGTYWIRAEDALAGTFGSDTFQDWCKALLPFSGSESTYDFTDVVLKIETGVFQSLGSFDIFELQTTGDNIVIKNLRIEDIGSVYDKPTKGALGIVLDGAHNRLDNVYLSTKGSYPYGYGEAFGKGGRNVVRHQKHCGILVRGYANHVKDCTIIHRCFGHALFMQAADEPLIEGCYIEGEMRLTDDMLAEKGSGSIADKVHFMTYFGYPIPPGYAMCTGEEGIRAYDGGQTWIDGEVINRRAMNPTVLNCLIKNMRGGVTLTHAGGKKVVKGTTALGCSRGFAIGSGDIVDCYADTQYGPALGVDYERDSGMNAEITLLPNQGPVVNGAGYVAFIMGKNHKIVLRSREERPDQSFPIRMGGNTENIGSLDKVSNFAASNISIENYTSVPIMLGDKTENISGLSGGLVSDSGSDNHISHVPQEVFKTEDAASVVENGVVENEVIIPVNGTYYLEYSLSGAACCSFAISLGDDTLETLTCPAGATETNRLRSSSPLFLCAGTHTVRIASDSSGWTLNGINVLLDYPETPVVPHLETFSCRGKSMGEFQRSDCTVFPGQTVLLKPEAMPGGSWSWKGPNGFFSSERTVTLSALQKKRSGSYVVTFKNAGGYETSYPFDIQVQDSIHIEAEDFTAMKGAVTEDTSDEGRGRCVADLSAGDWMEYSINVPYRAMYVIGYRVSSESSGRFSVRLDGQSIDEVSFDGGHSTWKTASSKALIQLEPGVKTVRITATSSGAKLNWIRLRAMDVIVPQTLPVVFSQDDLGSGQHFFSTGVLDVSGQSNMDVHVVFKDGSKLNLYYQMDGGTPVALKNQIRGSGLRMASACGLQGNLFKLMAKGRDVTSNIRGIYLIEASLPFARIEAEEYDDAQGTQQEETSDEGGGMNMGSIKNGNWLMYRNRNLSGVGRIKARVANIYSGGIMDVRIGSVHGKKIGTLEIPKTGGWQHWRTVEAPLKRVVGIYDVYLVFRHEEANVGNINWFEFSK